MVHGPIPLPLRDRPGLALFLLVFAFYLYTLAPSVTWADGARLQLEVVLGGSNYWFRDELRHLPDDGLPFSRLGVMPWDHPLYVMLGQAFLLIPFGEPAARINLMSALAGAIAVTLVYQIGVVLVRDRWAASFGALALAVSHTFWFHAVTAEVYTLHAAFMSGLLLLVLVHTESRGVARPYPGQGKEQWEKGTVVTGSSPYPFRLVSFPLSLGGWGTRPNPRPGGALALRGRQQRRRWSDLKLFSLVAGLGLANHLMLALTLLPAVIYLGLTSRHGQVVRSEAGSQENLPYPSDASWLSLELLTARVSLVGLFLIGFAPWWVQFVRMARLVGMPASLEFASGVGWLPGMFATQSPSTVAANLGDYARLLVYQFTPIGVAFGIYGFCCLRRTQASVAAFLVAHFVAHEAFSANYPVADRFAFHLPSYLIFALFITSGVAGLFSKLRTRADTHRPNLAAGLRVTVLAALVMPVGIYALMPVLVRTAGLTATDLGIPSVGDRDGLAYFLDPNQRGDDSAARFGRSTLTKLAPNALVFAAKPADHETYLVLRYFQEAEGLRRDVQLDQVLFVPERDVPRTVLAKARAQASCRPLYLASLSSAVYPLATLQAEFDVVPEAHLYRLVPHHVTAAAVQCLKTADDVADVSLVQLIRSALQ